MRVTFLKSGGTPCVSGRHSHDWPWKTIPETAAGLLGCCLARMLWNHDRLGGAKNTAVSEAQVSAKRSALRTCEDRFQDAQRFASLDVVHAQASAQIARGLRLSKVWCFAVLLLPGFGCAQNLLPDHAFVQLGTAGSTRAATAGIIWDWGREWKVGSGRVTGYWEASLSAWSHPVSGERRTAWLSQLGLIPVFRYRASGALEDWFAEAGVGATFTSTLYESDQKRFSTSFNFGDHIAIGRSFGLHQQHEVSVRIEHYSNAGIKHPNPGVNFVQMRYSYALP